MILAQRFYNLLSGLESGNMGPEMYANPQSLYNYEKLIWEPSYYIGQAEKDLWQDCAGIIPNYIGRGGDIVEFGPGDSEEVFKTSRVVQALDSSRYIAFDYNKEPIRQALETIKTIKNDIEAVSIQGDFWDLSFPIENRSTAIMAGVSIGNLPLPLMRRDPLPELSLALGHLVRKIRGGHLIFTADLRLPEFADDFYLRAYSHECHGHFNLDVLNRVAQETDIRDFDPGKFEYRCLFNEKGSQIAHLAVSTVTQNPVLAGEKFSIEAGEYLHLQNSFKFRPQILDLAIQKAGLKAEVVLGHQTPMRLYVVKAVQEGQKEIKAPEAA